MSRFRPYNPTTDLLRLCRSLNITIPLRATGELRTTYPQCAENRRNPDNVSRSTFEKVSGTATTAAGRALSNARARRQLAPTRPAPAFP